MRLIDADALLDKTVKKNRAWKSITNSEGENLEEIVLEIPTVQAVPLSELQAIIDSGLYEEDVVRYKMICVLVNLYADMRGDTE